MNQRYYSVSISDERIVITAESNGDSVVVEYDNQPEAFTELSQYFRGVESNKID